MEIKGIGIDLLDIDYIERMYLKHKKYFLDRYYSPFEIEKFFQIKNSRRGFEFLAGRFAGKEALYKATQINFNPKEVSIVNDLTGKPYIEWINGKEKIGENISISHYGQYVMALVIVERREMCRYLKLKRK